MRGRKPCFTAAQDAKLKAMVAAGAGNAEIARAFRCSESTVKNRLQFLGVTRRTAAAERERAKGRVRELFEAGLPYGDIAGEVGLMRRDVVRMCRDMGLSRTLSSAAQREAGEAWRAEHPKRRVGGPWHVQGDGPLARRFNAQQDEVWANGGPKPVRYKDDYYEGVFFDV